MFSAGNKNERNYNSLPLYTIIQWAEINTELPVGIRTTYPTISHYPNSKLALIGPCIANIFSHYNQKDATFLNLFISVRRSTRFRQFFRPSSGA